MASIPWKQWKEYFLSIGDHIKCFIKHLLCLCEIILKQVSDYNRIIVLESGDDEMERVIKERAETSEREDDKEEISRTKVQVYNEITRPMIDSLADPSKAVKVYIVHCTHFLSSHWIKAHSWFWKSVHQSVGNARAVRDLKEHFQTVCL